MVRRTKQFIEYTGTLMERFLSRYNLGMRAKLIIIFVIIKVLPLVLLAFMAWKQSQLLGSELRQRTQELTGKANESLRTMGDIAIADSVRALNDFATEDIERITTEIAKNVASFLYKRDADIRYVSKLPVSEEAYQLFMESKTSALINQGSWALADDGKTWVRTDTPAPLPKAVSSNPENDAQNSFHSRPRDQFEVEDRPLYLELTYIDLEGNETIKITTSGQMSPEKRNISNRSNTYVKAETYWADLQQLKPGEIYVSDVIGAYVGANYIGMYTPEVLKAVAPAHPNAEQLHHIGGLPPEEFDKIARQQAYSGRENPNGIRFKGLVRWGMPVTNEAGAITGYVTLALDHDHIMEFTDHTTPMFERYVEIPSAYEGNYAFIWDYKCRSITHPRHHSIYGFNPETGEPEIPWLEQTLYNDWKASGVEDLWEYLEDKPMFFEQSRTKRGSAELIKRGLVGLDGRWLNHAPQCIGWMDVTRDGGSGSFLILWSGLWKLTTAAAIPYYTGQYSPEVQGNHRGFAMVTVGAGFEDFERPARKTEATLDRLVTETDSELSGISQTTEKAIASNLMRTTIELVVSAGIMIVLVVLVAIWMASAFTRSITNLVNGISKFRAGQRHFRFRAKVKDELGTLADSFDEMADSLVASDRGPLLITNMDLIIIYANDDAARAMAGTPSDVLGRRYTEISIYAPGSVYDPIKALNEGREAEVFRANDGTYFRPHATYLTDRAGQKIGYIVTSMDVTEISEQQHLLATQKRLLDTIFESSPDLIWYRDMKGTLLALNPRYAALSGKPPAELVGRNVTADKSPESGVLLQEHNRRILEEKKPLYLEESFTFADGHEETLDVVLTPVYAGAGETPVGILGFARNVTARVRVEQELRYMHGELERAVAEANQANEHKGQFLARMSHEIRTPMNAIIGMTGIVKRKLDQPITNVADIRVDVDQIETSSQHLMGLLNDILDLSKIEAGKIELAVETFDLAKLIDSAAAIIRPRCAHKGIEFHVHADLSASVNFVGDSLRLRQVLLNLLGNAVKFTPECGSIHFTVQEETVQDGRACLTFSVRDTGIGISETAMQLLFKPFEQTNNQISQKYGGTGLGLVISRSIVQLFGGDITVQSREGEGSEFLFSIWLPRAEQQDAAPLNTADATGLLKNKRALLVDDVDINRMIAAHMLEFTGMQIDEAGDGVEAVRTFVESPPGTYDIIYMDVQMPNMDGHEAALTIRALDRPDAQTVPIVTLTANAFKEDIDHAIASGMNAHLAKPLDIEKLLEVTLRLLNIKL